jgi:hypothetical protein
MTERFVIREQATGKWFGRFGSHQAACTWGDRYMGHPDWCVYTERERKLLLASLKAA